MVRHGAICVCDECCFSCIHLDRTTGTRNYCCWKRDCCTGEW